MGKVHSRPKGNLGIMVTILLWLVSIGLVFSTIDSDHLPFAFCTIVFILLSAWGHVIVFPLYYKNSQLLEGFVWGCTLGITVASLLISVIVYIIGWYLPAIFAIVTIIPGILLLYLRFKRIGNTKPASRQDLDLRILFTVLFIITLFFYFPYKNIGVLVGDKYLYAWLFGHDFLNRMVHVDSLSRGIPLEGFFFAGEKLSYYWLAYVYPALLHNIKWINLEIQQLLQITQLFYGLLTTAGIVLFLKQYIHQKKILSILILMAFFCYSYVGLYNIGFKTLGAYVVEIIPSYLGEKLSVFSGFSHGFYRFYLVEPQGTLAIAIMMMIFSLYNKKATFYVFIVMGMLLGLLFGVEATNGIMIIVWFVGMSLFTLFMNKDERYSLVKKHLFSLIIGGMIILLLFAIEMYSFKTGKGVLKLAVNWFPVITGPFYFILAYGPIFLLGIAGLYRFLKNRENPDHLLYHYILLFIIGIFFVFFITNPTEAHFGLLKATRIIPISLLMFSAYLFNTILLSQKLKKVIIILLILSLPSLFTDNFIASDISNPSTYVRASDMEAARWIKKNTPKDAIIQAEPNYPGEENGKWPKYAYSFIPIFAERKTAIGEWKVSSQEHSKPTEVSERFHSIGRMFSTTNIDECVEILRKYKINYLYIGQLEKRLYPAGVKKFENCTLYFVKVFSKYGVDIFRFRQETDHGISNNHS